MQREYTRKKRQQRQRTAGRLSRCSHDPGFGWSSGAGLPGPKVHCRSSLPEPSFPSRHYKLFSAFRSTEKTLSFFVQLSFASANVMLPGERSPKAKAQLRE